MILHPLVTCGLCRACRGDDDVHCSASEFPAAMVPGAWDRYLERRGLRRCTDRTIVDRSELETHLEQVRRSGVALEIGEFQAGLSCLAAPVWSPAGAAVASVAVSLPSAEFQARRWDLEGAVRRGALVATRAVNSC